MECVYDNCRWYAQTKKNARRHVGSVFLCCDCFLFVVASQSVYSSCLSPDFKSFKTPATTSFVTWMDAVVAWMRAVFLPSSSSPFRIFVWWLLLLLLLLLLPLLCVGDSSWYTSEHRKVLLAYQPYSTRKSPDSSRQSACCGMRC
jgi:hypothetical protein